MERGEPGSPPRHHDRWSRHSDLNRGPAVYETAALPLSYVGAVANVPRLRQHGRGRGRRYGWICSTVAIANRPTVYASSSAMAVTARKTAIDAKMRGSALLRRWFTVGSRPSVDGGRRAQRTRSGQRQDPLPRRCADTVRRYYSRPATRLTPGCRRGRRPGDSARHAKAGVSSRSRGNDVEKDQPRPPAEAVPGHPGGARRRFRSRLERERRGQAHPGPLGSFALGWIVLGLQAIHLDRPALATGAGAA